MTLFGEADDALRAIKVSPGEYVGLVLNPALRQDRANIDRLAAQVRRSWPGLNVLIYYGDEIRVEVIQTIEDLPPLFDDEEDADGPTPPDNPTKEDPVEGQS